ncbi:uncharacterized protein DUF1700 [Arthrobacter sp. AG1021]|nr:uncharacterized protein DUF1700 [Arthrobacter sp. AG1021]
MNMTENHGAVGKYLEALDHELRKVPPARREAVVADLAEHIDEARERGRSDDQIIAGLGPVQAIAAEVQADFADGAVEMEQRAKRKVLGFIALAAGVLAAVVDTWIYPSLNVDEFWPDWLHSSAINYDASTRFGAGLMLLFLLPGLMVAAGSMMKSPAARICRTVAAVIVTALPFVIGFNLGVFYLPLIVAAWMIVGVSYPRQQRAQGRRHLPLRMTAGLAAGVPAAALLAGLATGTVETGVLGIAVLAVLVLAAVGAILGLRAAYWVLAACGALLLVASVFDMGMLVLGFWIAGTIYFFAGLAGLLRLQPAPKA